MSPVQWLVTPCAAYMFVACSIVWLNFVKNVVYTCFVDKFRYWCIHTTNMSLASWSVMVHDELGVPSRYTCGPCHVDVTVCLFFHCKTFIVFILLILAFSCTEWKLMWTPLVQSKVSWIQRCPYFGGFWYISSRHGSTYSCQWVLQKHNPELARKITRV